MDNDDDAPRPAALVQPQVVYEISTNALLGSACVMVGCVLAISLVVYMRS